MNSNFYYLLICRLAALSLAAANPTFRIISSDDMFSLRLWNLGWTCRSDCSHICGSGIFPLPDYANMPNDVGLSTQLHPSTGARELQDKQHLKISSSSDTVNRADKALGPTKPARINTNNIRGLITLTVPPDPIFLAHRAIEMSILIPPQPIDPRFAYACTVEHYVDLLTMEPRLSILVSVSLDPDMLIDDHDLDVT